MFKMYLLPFVATLLALPIYLDRADASPLVAHNLATTAPVSPAQLIAVRGRVVVRGGAHRGGAVIHGRAVVRGGTVVRGRAVVRGGAYRVGHRYYGGVWYGHVRRFYGGRWWPYGVGSCWTSTPIGYVWACG
jgi:hypothetical protein